MTAVTQLFKYKSAGGTELLIQRPWRHMTAVPQLFKYRSAGGTELLLIQWPCPAPDGLRTPELSPSFKLGWPESSSLNGSWAFKLPNTPTQAQSDPSTPPELHTRDEDYYFHDGSCVISVQGRLFKIHRSLLERHSSVFQGMFSLPQPGSSAPLSPTWGTNDENPVKCYDSIEEFRALCWALYAKPTEIAAQHNRATANVPRMIHVIAIAHKYAMENLEEWAFDALTKIAEAANINFFVTCKTWGNAVKLFGYAERCQQTKLSMQMQSAWLSAILNKGKEIVTIFKSGFKAAEESHLRKFHGQLYYAYLKVVTSNLKISPTNSVSPRSITNIVSFVTAGPQISELEEKYRVGLYHGFCSLTYLRRQLDTAPPLADNNQCTVHSTVCKSGWTSWWDKFLSDVQKGGSERIEDPGHLIRELETRVSSKPIYCINGYPNEIPCHALIKDQVVGLRKKFEDALADHFMVPT
ncbi:hypothetical protein AN958_02666 [Leucoagaricus sp. SymC.cos]|nr:hypothetical protein AN958_02666 [Leucoagaricus sp. SymC.cos]